MIENISPAEAARIALATPWKLRLEITRMALLPLARLQCALAGVAWGKGWLFYGLPILQRHRASTMHFGAHLTLRSLAASNPLAPNHPVVLTTREAGAALSIGDHVGITGGAVVCAQRVSIGSRVMIGANSILCDTDFHPLDAAVRRERPLDAATAPVVIEDDVFIGMGCLILKGVTIGRGSVIGAGSVVTRDVPAGVIAAGSPTRVIRAL